MSEEVTIQIKVPKEVLGLLDALFNKIDTCIVADNVPVKELVNDVQVMKEATGNNTINSNMTRPSLSDVVDYVKQHGYTNVPPQRFFDYYNHRNWANISDWRAKIDSWETNGINSNSPAVKEIKRDYSDNPPLPKHIYKT